MTTHPNPLPGVTPVWYEHANTKHARPMQYYFNGAPAELVAVAVNEKIGKVCGLRVKTKDGTTHDEFWDADGVIHGITYEKFEHFSGEC